MAGSLEAELPRPLPGRARAWLLAALFGAFFLSAGVLLALWAWMVAASWPHSEPDGDPAWGINFSCNYAEYLMLEEPGGADVPDDRPGRVAWCAATLGRLLDRTGAGDVRLSVEWSEVEPREGEFDFRLTDGLLQEAERRGVRVLLTVGMKGQRHPEYYLPGWLTRGLELPWGAAVDREPRVAEAALRMIDAVVRHTSASAAVDSWGADNEPLVTSPRASRWSISPEFVAREVAAIRAADQRGRPVVVNHAEVMAWFSGWDTALALGDVLGFSLYPFRNVPLPGLTIVVPVLELGPLIVNLPYYAGRARDEGKDFWITEMQAEPWFTGDPRLASPASPAANLSPGRLAENLRYARRSGASRVYLWGAEWWLFQEERFGDSRWIDLGRSVLDGP